MSAKWRDRLLTAAVRFMERNRRKADRGKPFVGDTDFLLVADAALSSPAEDVDVRMVVFRLLRALNGGATPDEVASVKREAQSYLDTTKRTRT